MVGVARAFVRRPVYCITWLLSGINLSLVVLPIHTYYAVYCHTGSRGGVIDLSRLTCRVTIVLRPRTFHVETPSLYDYDVSVTFNVSVNTFWRCSGL